MDKLAGTLKFSIEADDGGESGADVAARPFTKAKPYIKVCYDVSVEQLSDFMISRWGLRPPDIILSVISGQRGYRGWRKKEYQDAFQRGFARLFRSVSAWVFDHGFGHGISKLIGEAVKEEEERRLRNAVWKGRFKRFQNIILPRIVHIGFPLEQALSASKGCLNVPTPEMTSVYKISHSISVRNNPVKVTAATNTNVMDIDPFHTHYVVVSGSNTREAAMLRHRAVLDLHLYANLRRQLIQNRLQTSDADSTTDDDDDCYYTDLADFTSDFYPCEGIVQSGQDYDLEISRASDRVPVVGLLVQGGPEQLEHVLFYLENDVPVIIVNGSGYMADIIAGMMHDVSGGGSGGGGADNVHQHYVVDRNELLATRNDTFAKLRKWFPREMSRKKSDNAAADSSIAEGMSHANAPVDQPSSRAESPSFCEAALEHAYQQLCRIITRSVRDDGRRLITILNLKIADEFTNLDSYILQAAIAAENITHARNLTSAQMRLKTLLLLSVKWNEDKLAQKYLFDALNYQPSMLSQQFLSRLRVEHDVFELALVLKGRFQFINIFLEQNFKVHRYLNHKRLLVLFRRAEDSEFFQSVVFEGLLQNPMSATPDETFVVVALPKLIESLTGTKGIVDAYALTSASHGLYSLGGPEEAERKARLALLIWAILMNRQPLALILWKHCEDPLPTALFASQLYNALRKMCSEPELAAELEKHSRTFSEFAYNILDMAYNDAAILAFEALEQSNPDFQNKTPLLIAYEGRNRFFLTHPCCQKWLQHVYYGRMDVNRKLRFRFATFSLIRYLTDWVPESVKILSAAWLIFPIYFWISFPVTFSGSAEEDRKRKSGGHTLLSRIANEYGYNTGLDVSGSAAVAAGIDDMQNVAGTTASTAELKAAARDDSLLLSESYHFGPAVDVKRQPKFGLNMKMRSPTPSGTGPRKAQNRTIVEVSNLQQLPNVAGSSASLVSVSTIKRKLQSVSSLAMNAENEVMPLISSGMMHPGTLTGTPSAYLCGQQPAYNEVDRKPILSFTQSFSAMPSSASLMTQVIPELELEASSSTGSVAPKQPGVDFAESMPTTNAAELKSNFYADDMISECADELHPLCTLDTPDRTNAAQPIVLMTPNNPASSSTSAAVLSSGASGNYGTVSYTTSNEKSTAPDIVNEIFMAINEQRQQTPSLTPIPTTPRLPSDRKVDSGVFEFGAHDGVNVFGKIEATKNRRDSVRSSVSQITTANKVKSNKRVNISHAQFFGTSADGDKLVDFNLNAPPSTAVQLEPFKTTSCFAGVDVVDAKNLYQMSKCDAELAHILDIQRGNLRQRGQKNRIRRITGSNSASTTGATNFAANSSSEPPPPSGIPLHKKIFYVWSAPVTKFYSYLVLYLAFLIFYSTAALVPDCNVELSLRMDLIIWAWALAIGVELLVRTIQQVRRGHPINRERRAMELVSFGVFLIIYLLWRIINSGHFAISPFYSKIIALVGLMYFFIRVVYDFMPLSRHLGPLLLKVHKMVVYGFLIWFLLALPYVAASMVLMQAVLYPDLELSWDSLKQALDRAFVSFFLTPVGEIQTSTPACVSTSFATRFSNTSRHDDYHCYAGTNTNPKCPSSGVWPYFFFFQYFFILKLVLLTLLYAIFSIYMLKVDQEANAIWRFQRYKLILDFDARSAIPPPFSLLPHIFLLLKWASRSCVHWVNFFKGRKGRYSYDKQQDREGFLLFNGRRRRESMHAAAAAVDADASTANVESLKLLTHEYAHPRMTSQLRRLMRQSNYWHALAAEHWDVWSAKQRDEAAAKTAHETLHAVVKLRDEVATMKGLMKRWRNSAPANAVTA